MKKHKKIFFSFLLSLFFVLPAVANAGIDVGDLVKTKESSSVYLIQADGTRLVFPNSVVYKSYYKNFDNIKIVSFEELKKYPFAGNVPLKTNSLVKFDFNPKVYQVKSDKELEWIKTPEGLKGLGYDFANVVDLSEIFFSDYKVRSANGSYNEVASRIDSLFIDQEKARIAQKAASSSKGLVEALNDEYSVFWNHKEYEKFMEWVNNDSFEGIGAQIENKGNALKVISPLKGSPAEAAGLMAGDEIVFIDNFNAKGLDVNKAVMLIRGPKGTTVVLKVKRDGVADLVPVSIVRDVIVVNQFEWEVKKTPASNEVVYMSLSLFSQSAWQDITKNMQDILDKNPKAIIFDLRNNPGGYMSMAIDIASKWLDQSQVVLFEERAGGQEIEHKSNQYNFFKGIPTIVLVNKGSASASEIVAGALQDYGVAELLGDQTFGKGVAQEIITLSDGNVMKLTVSKWFTPKRREINNIGIEPNIVVKLEDDTSGVDEQLEAALVEIDNMIKNKK